MRNSTQKLERKKALGFTLIELLFAIAISVLLLTVTLSGFYSYRKRQAVDVSAQVVLNTLREARSKTLDSLNASTYGVHIATDHIILFQGSAFDLSDPANEVKHLARPSEITEKTLTSDEVIFQRLTGEVTSFGTLTVSVPGEPDTAKQIFIESTGISYVQ